MGMDKTAQMNIMASVPERYKKILVTEIKET